MPRFFISVSMVAAALTGSVLALPAAAQFAKPEDAIAYRKGAMNVMAAHFGRVAAMAGGRVPFDAKAAADNAELANIMSKLPFAAFLPGTDGANSKAQAKVFSEPDKFRAAAAKMQEEMTKLSAAAKAGNLDAIKTAVGATGGTCKACHDEYWKQ